MHDFLQSVKASERVSSSLRDAISVNTGVEDGVLAALAQGRDVILAGSAGSGKTHLLMNVQKRAHTLGLPPLVQWPYREGAPRDRHIRVIPDATALPSGLRPKMLERCSNCMAIVVAVNEGPLHRLAESDRVYAGILAMLHAIQRGVAPDPRPDLPTVFDVGGYDPLERGALERILGIPLLREVVESTSCSCEHPRVCPRRQSWALLTSRHVRSRVNELLQAVDLPGRPVLFRDLWDFVSDVALGGSCSDDPPSSPWFWRVFHGSSKLTQWLLEVVDPSFIVFPRIGAHLWYGDWNHVTLRGKDDTVSNPVLPSSSEIRRPDIHKWLITQLFFLSASVPIPEILRHQVDLRLMQATRSGDAHQIISTLNAYMAYGQGMPSAQDLVLWSDIAIERRTKRPSGQFALGRVPASEFEIRSSLAVANHPDPQFQVKGSRHFLVHRPTKAALSLTSGTIDLLTRGRSYRSADRPHTDLEWHISRFFFDVASYVSLCSELNVLQVDFKNMSSRSFRYRIALDGRKIEAWSV